MGWTTQMAVRTRAAVKHAGQGGASGFQRHERFRYHLIGACVSKGGCQHAGRKVAFVAWARACARP